MQGVNYEDLVGKRLVSSVVNAKGMMLIPVDTILTKNHIDKLEKFNIDIFDIHVESAEKKQAAATEAAAGSTESGKLLKRTDALLQEIGKVIESTGKIPKADIEESLLPTIMEATQSRNIYKLIAELKAEGDFRFKHSIGVAYIAALLGRWLKMDESEIAILTAAASLCDIGSIKLPTALMHKTTELDPDEYEEMKNHTVIGYEMLRESDLDPRIALVALQHHEREDGSGYPLQLKTVQIEPFSKIVALADVYVAMTSERPQRPPLPFYEVINELYGQIVHNRFDSAIGMTFLNRLMTAQVGSDVILSDGRRGKIVLIHANYPASPLVSIGDEFVDLSKTDAIRITEIVG